MLGGYQILDLRSIDLSRATTESSITDVAVLSQLLNIRDHIQKTYDFSKPLHNQLKPLLIRYRDKKVGEKHEVALYGNIEVINVYYKFRIIANNEGEQLTINVEFEEKTDEYDNKYWDIKTAKILLTSEVDIFENIVDKDGHKRFIEGDITTNEYEGFTYTYKKWSLSGTHLMIVLAGEIEGETIIDSTNNNLGKVNLPQWIKDKLLSLVGNSIDRKLIYLYGTDTTYQSTTQVLSTDFNILLSGVTLSQKRYFRVEFNFLIDDESQD